jgi:TetR/AcrR family transcriptional repressor of nem operon
MSSELSKAERTRQFIIETTAPIFNMKGYEGTSLSDLTEATGLTKGSIYGNFGNKEEVALACFDHNLGRVSHTIAERIAQAPTFFDKLMVYVQVYNSYSAMPFPKGGCPILNTAIEADDTNPLLKEKAANAILKWKKNIISLIQSGIQAGEFRKDTDATQTALAVIALIEGGIMIAKVTAQPGNLDKVLKTVEMLLTQLIL